MYILDGYVDEKLAILSTEDEAEEGTKPASWALFVAQPGESSSEGSSNIRKLAERIGAVGTVPGGGDIVAAGQRPLQ